MRDNWTDEQITIVLYEYCRRPFGQFNGTRTVLSSYNQKCCINGINNPSLLQASHIVDWSIDEANRTNPQNGLCLNALFHKAYDDNLLGITPDYEIVIAKDFFFGKPHGVDEATMSFIMGFDHKQIIMPKRFLPDRDLLAQHYEKFTKIAI